MIESLNEVELKEVLEEVLEDVLGDRCAQTKDNSSISFPAAVVRPLPCSPVSTRVAKPEGCHSSLART